MILCVCIYVSLICLHSTWRVSRKHIVLPNDLLKASTLAVFMTSGATSFQSLCNYIQFFTKTLKVLIILTILLIKLCNSKLVWFQCIQKSEIIGLSSFYLNLIGDFISGLFKNDNQISSNNRIVISF